MSARWSLEIFIDRRRLLFPPTFVTLKVSRTFAISSRAPIDSRYRGDPFCLRQINKYYILTIAEDTQYMTVASKSLSSRWFQWHYYYHTIIALNRSSSSRFEDLFPLKLDQEPPVQQLNDWWVLNVYNF